MFVSVFHVVCKLYHLTFYKFNKGNKCNPPLLHVETFSRASYYQLALEQLYSHPEALEVLGTPLNVHYLKLTDKYNFVDIADAKVTCSSRCGVGANCGLGAHWVEEGLL